MKSFRDKIAVITGGASGVGLAIGMKLGKAGAKLVLADVEEGALKKAVEGAKAAGIDAIGQLTDVTKQDQVDALAKKSFDHFGAVHLVFNNAGIGGGGGQVVWDWPIESWKWSLDVSLYGIINGMRAFVPRLIEQGQECHIVNTSSGAGILAMPEVPPPYATAKAAAIILTEALYHQLKQMGKDFIKVSCLFPGPHIVATSLYDSERNRPKEYAIKGGYQGVSFKTAEEMQSTILQFTGKKIDITPPEEFADYTYQALLEDRFWILPLTDEFRQAMREHTESMISERNPVLHAAL